MASETGHLPTEFWSSLESRVGYKVKLDTVAIVEDEDTGLTGKAACWRI